MNQMQYWAAIFLAMLTGAVVTLAVASAFDYLVIPKRRAKTIDLVAYRNRVIEVLRPYTFVSHVTLEHDFGAPAVGLRLMFTVRGSWFNLSTSADDKELWLDTVIAALYQSLPLIQNASASIVDLTQRQGSVLTIEPKDVAVARGQRCAEANRLAADLHEQIKDILLLRAEA